MFSLFFVALCCAGPIPKELGNLFELNELWLHDNQLTGVWEGQDCSSLTETRLLHVKYVPRTRG